MKINLSILSKASWALAALACLLLSCSQDDDDKFTTDAQVKVQEVRMDFVDMDDRDLVKDDFANFRVITRNGISANTHLIVDHGKYHLGFTPALPTDSIGKDSVKMTYLVHWGNKTVADVACTFRLDSIRLAFGNKRYYYSTTEKSYGRYVNNPVKIRVGEDQHYREEGSGKIYVVFYFPNSRLQSTEGVDYDVTIKGFMGQYITPNQRLLAEGEGETEGTTAIALGIDGLTHNYYDENGLLQEPYEVTYEIKSLQLFGNNEKRLVKITNSGDCAHNKIKACSLDGRELDLGLVVKKDMFGGEYIQLTFE